MFENITYEISDSTFLDRFYSQNVLYKVSTNLILRRYLSSQENRRKTHVKPIYLQILENYVGITETIMMFLYSLLEKKKDHTKSLLYHYTKISVKEGNGTDIETRKNTWNILRGFQNKSDTELFDLLGLKKPEEILSTIDRNKILDLQNKLGSEGEIIKKGYTEFRYIINAIENILSNRIENAQGKPLPLYKIYNKLKHGAQYIDEPNTDKVYIISKVTSTSPNSSSCESFYLECSVKDAVFLAEQSKIIAQSLESLLSVISPTFEQ